MTEIFDKMAVNTFFVYKGDVYRKRGPWWGENVITGHGVYGIPNDAVVTPLYNCPVRTGRKAERILYVNEDGLLHRTTGPAVIWGYGHQEWHQYGKLHRTDGPAVERDDGYSAWYHYDNLHRTDGPAIKHSSGRQEWYQHGELHREGGPAVIWSNGSQEWFLHGKRHRVNGPACIWPASEKHYYINDNMIDDPLTMLLLDNAQL